MRISGSLARCLFASSLIFLNLIPGVNANAVDQTVLANMDQTCSASNFIRANVRIAYKFVVPFASTISSIQFKMSDATTGSGTSAIIYADSNGTMSTVVGTLPWNNYDSTSKIVTFTGSATLSSSGNYWLELFNNSMNIIPCTTTSTTFTGATGWSISSKTATPPTGTESTSTYWWVASITASPVEPPTISVPSITSVATRRASTSISVSTNQSGRVYFYANGKRISKCVGINTVGTAPSLTATCNWTPSIQGAAVITAKLVVSSSSSVLSLPATVKVQPRKSYR